MLSLIRKDVAVARWFLWLILPLYAIQLVGIADSPPARIVVTLIFSTLLAFGAIWLDESQSTEILWNSLPVNRRDVVLARYATTLLGTVVGLGIGWLVGKLMQPATAFGPGLLATLFFMLAVAGALFLPCYFRWGIGRGLQAFSLVVLGLVAIVAVGTSLLELGSGGPESLGNIVAGAIATLALLVLCASCALSIRLYERRDC
jgi:ABC-2 type transport system permease protein